MKIKGKFVLLDVLEFADWLPFQQVNRRIKLVQHHHTLVPAYRHFEGDNHFELCHGMENYHLTRGFAEIAQHFTTFPDGKIMICRNINTIPAGIKGANTYGICIENLGNFDKGKDSMSQEHKDTIVAMTRILLNHFKLIPGDQTVVYHHWYDTNLGRRIKKEGTGTTKTCPGTAFFGGNTVADFTQNFLPLL